MIIIMITVLLLRLLIVRMKNSVELHCGLTLILSFFQIPSIFQLHRHSTDSKMAEGTRHFVWFMLLVMMTMIMVVVLF